MLYLRLLVAALFAAVRARRDLVLENLALRHQLAVYTRGRRRPRQFQGAGQNRGQDFGLGGQLLNFLTNRDSNRASANASYGQIGTDIAALNASQRGQLASAQQAAIQMLANLSGPQNAVGYQRALAGLSGPGPNQGSATIDPLALLKNLYQPANIEDIYPGGPPQPSGLDAEQVLQQIFSQIGQSPPDFGSLPDYGFGADAQPPTDGVTGQGATDPATGTDGTLVPTDPVPSETPGNVPPLKAALIAAQKAYDGAPEGPEKEALRLAVIEAANAWLYGDTPTVPAVPTDPATGAAATLAPPDPAIVPPGVVPHQPGTVPPVAPLPPFIGENPPPAPPRPLPTDESGVMQTPPTIGGAPPQPPSIQPQPAIRPQLPQWPVPQPFGENLPYRPPPGAGGFQPGLSSGRPPPGDTPQSAPFVPTPFNQLFPQGFPTAAHGGMYDQGPVIVGERGPELAMASPSGLLQVQPITQDQAQGLAAPQQMPQQRPMRQNLIGSASRQPGRSRGAATGGTFTTTSYSDPQLVNAPPIQQLQGETDTPSFQNLDTEFGGERLPSVINLQHFGQLDPSSQEYTQGIYNQGAQVDFRDIIARSLRAAPQGASFGPARYAG